MQGGFRAQSRLLLPLSIAWLSSVFLSSCAFPVDQSTAAIPPQQVQVVEAQQAHERKVEITVEAPVVRILPDDLEGLTHQRFIIALSNGTTVLIAHDTRMAPHIPLSVGDTVRIHGEYIWNERGGVIHWTHHTDTPRHEGGWIDFNGERYQ